MAIIFTRSAIAGGDLNTWATYEAEQNKRSIGVITSQLYDDSGTLKAKVGLVGIDNGTYKGIVEIDADESIDLSGCANANWCKIELSVAGTIGTIAATTIAGATNFDVIPSDFTTAFSGLKGGFYINVTKRCLGIAWKNSSGTLKGIINTHSNEDSWSGYCYDGASTTNKLNWFKMKNFYNCKGEYEIGDWNMRAAGGGTNTKNISHTISQWLKIRNLSAWIRDDSDSFLHPLCTYLDSADPSLIIGGLGIITNNVIPLIRRTGSPFDSNSYDASPYNRGWIYFNLSE